MFLHVFSILNPRFDRKKASQGYELNRIVYAFAIDGFSLDIEGN